MWSLHEEDVWNIKNFWENAFAFVLSVTNKLWASLLYFWNTVFLVKFGFVKFATNSERMIVIVSARNAVRMERLTTNARRDAIVVLVILLPYWTAHARKSYAVCVILPVYNLNLQSVSEPIKRNDALIS